MMIKSVLLICSLLAVGGFNVFHQRAVDEPDNAAHVKWLEERYADATSIKEGMTRKELMKLFGADGGIQPPHAQRYSLKNSGLIKVDVQFDVPDSVKLKVPEVGMSQDSQGDYLFFGDEQASYNGLIKIKSISKPYLQPSAID